MGSFISCCWRHSYCTASIQFSVPEWELQDRPLAFLADKWTAVGVTNSRVHAMTFTRIRRFLRHTKEPDVFCKISGDLRSEEDIEVIVC